MARPSSGADSEGPPCGRAAASSDAVAAATGTAERRVSYNVAPAAALPGRWGLLDVLRLVFRYVREHALRLMHRNCGDFGTEDEDAGEEPRDAGDMVADEEPRDAGVVVGKNVGGSPGGKKKNKKKNQNNPPEAPKKKKKKKNRQNKNNQLGAPEKKHHACIYRDWRPRPVPSLEGSLNAATAAGLDTNSTPTTPASPLMVGDEMVWGDELRRFADYCKKSLTCSKKILCHRCFFEKQYRTGSFPSSGMFLHCFQKHKPRGFKCQACLVQVGTTRELPLHAHFCHELHSGWWNEKYYKDKMEVMKRD